MIRAIPHEIDRCLLVPIDAYWCLVVPFGAGGDRMNIRVDQETEEALERVRAAIGARSAAETVRVLVRVAEDEIGRAELSVRRTGESALSTWPIDVGALARARQFRRR